MKKQDLTHPRTPSDLDRRYGLGRQKETFQETIEQAGQVTGEAAAAAGRVNQAILESVTAKNAALKAAEEASAAAKKAEAAAKAANEAANLGNQAVVAAQEAAAMAAQAAEEAHISSRKALEAAAKATAAAKEALAVAVNRAPAILETAAGEQILVTDSEAGPLRGLWIFGRTTRTGNALVNVGQTGAITVTVGGKEISVTAAGGLAGVPVAAAGNYTDSQGQQWAADYVDFARGVSVQIIGRIEHYAGEPVEGPYLSSSGDLSPGATVYYVLETAVEKPLPTAEVEAYGSLVSLYPTTEVKSNVWAYLKIGYGADTKNYIQKRMEAKL